MVSWCRVALLVLLIVLAGCRAGRDAPSSAIALADPLRSPFDALPEDGVVPAPDPAPATGAAPGDRIALRALGLVGVRYRYGGDRPERGFDCSGFVRWVYREHDGVALPRASHEMQRVAAPEVAAAELAAGDLVFFRIGARVAHVGIYVGDGSFVHAPSRGGAVRVDRLDDRYWRLRYAGARRVLAGLEDRRAAG